MLEFKIKAIINNDFKTYKNIYLINNEETTKVLFYSMLKDIIKNNNRLYYKDLKNNNFDDLKTYKTSNYYLLSFKDVLNDIKNGGMIYTFNITLEA